MEKSFDFGALLKNHEKKHKSKPSQFVSVAGGVKKRLESTQKRRRSSRLTIFDRIRNLSASRCDSPVKLTETQQKVERRRQQLEKWKEEKEKRKKEAAAQKKKPFVAGVANSSWKLPPPPPRPVPSSSGRITRSQTRNKTKEDLLASKQSQKSNSFSFAPKNAVFHPPQIKNLTTLPILALVKSKKDKKAPVSFSFNPIMPVRSEPKQLHSRAFTNLPSNHLDTRSKAIETRARKKVAKPVPKATYLHSSSSSEIEHSSIQTSLSSASIGNIRSSGSDSEFATVQSLSSEHECTKALQNSSRENDARSLKSSSSCELEKTKTRSPVLVNKSRVSLAPPPKAKTPRKSMTPRKLRASIHNDKLTPKRPVPKSESSSEERLRSPKSPVGSMTPEQIAEEAKKISPCVTLSRGKANARKEMKKKLEEGLLDEDTSDIDNIDHFRRQLASEIKRITEMCDTWDKISEQLTLPDYAQELILGAVGQARLLMSQKLQQFANLVERCARPEPGTALVTPADLHGFWDMVFMQVENVDMRFKKLEELQGRNWQEEQPPRVPKPRALPKPAAKPKAAATSRLRDMIAAARKAKQSEQPLAVTNDKTFEAGFFCVRSPLRSSASASASASASPATPVNKHNLLKAVLSSEAKKASASKNSASFAMLRASALGKNVECEGIAVLPQTPVQQVNLTPAPVRSILKQTQDNALKSVNKCIKTVLFDNYSDTENDTNVEIEGQMEINTDSGLSSMDLEKDSVQKGKEEDSVEKIKEDLVQDKETTKKGKENRKLIRQDAVSEDLSPVMTRSRRKSMQTPQTEEKTPTRAARKKKVLEELENIVGEEKTLARSGRKKKVQEVENIALEKKSPIRSVRKKKEQEFENVVLGEKTPPKRSTRSRKSRQEVVT